MSTVSELATKTSSKIHNVSATAQQVNSKAGEASDLSKKVHEYTGKIGEQAALRAASPNSGETPENPAYRTPPSPMVLNLYKKQCHP